jgi:hypothetical protein
MLLALTDDELDVISHCVSNLDAFKAEGVAYDLAWRRPDTDRVRKVVEDLKVRLEIAAEQKDREG